MVLFYAGSAPCSRATLPTGTTGTAALRGEDIVKRLGAKTALDGVSMTLRQGEILLLDEPLAAMGAREAGLIIDLVLRLKEKQGLSIVMIMHNYAQTLDIADRVMLMQRGRMTYEREAASTSVAELMDIVRREYRSMRTAAS
jgi:simple sugar transport system ATP-binding protein